MSKQRNIRKRRAADDDDDSPNLSGGEEPRLSAEEIKLLQKQRRKRAGVDATALAGAVEKKSTSTKLIPRVEAEGGAPDGLHAAFSKERKQYTEDDDPEMKRFIEEQLARRLGKELPQDVTNATARRPATLEDQALEAVAPKQKAFDTDPGAAFVAGVTEVALDVTHRLRNIEATEAAKAALLVKGRGPAGHMGRVYDDDDFGSTAGRTGGTRRSNFPVSFGRQNPKEVAFLQESAAKKARLREEAAERKRNKEKEFKGW